MKHLTAIAYYERISEVILPHLNGRPLAASLPHVPWLERFGSAGSAFQMIGDLRSLLWAAKSGVHEFLVHASRVPTLHLPSSLLVRIAPRAPGARIRDCARAALGFRELLESLELHSYVKSELTSSFLLSVPLDTSGGRTGARSGYREVAEFARALTEQVNLGKDSVHLDWRINDIRRATLCPYSLQHASPLTVSTPLTWAEVEGLASGSREKFYGPDEVLRRVEQFGDLHSETLLGRQHLPVSVQRWLEAA